MIDFKSVKIQDKKIYEKYLAEDCQRGCEFSFANLYIWGRQKIAFAEKHIVIFSQFNRRSVYPYPVGADDKKKALDAIIKDSSERGIPCRITGLNQEAERFISEAYPDLFSFHCDRDSFDYVYHIDDLADLKGKKYQRKRNHFNRFCVNNPEYSVEPVSESNVGKMLEFAERWYEKKLAENPNADFQMEQAAIAKALHNYKALELEGLSLAVDGEIVAITLGSRLSHDTFDVHFEKALAEVDGAYTAINCEFAKYIRSKYSEIKFLNREEDMGIEGLRKAKESYYPHHMVEKCWACLREEGYDY